MHEKLMCVRYAYRDVGNFQLPRGPEVEFILDRWATSDCYLTIVRFSGSLLLSREKNASNHWSKNNWMSLDQRSSINYKRWCGVERIHNFPGTFIYMRCQAHGVKYSLLQGASLINGQFQALRNDVRTQNCLIFWVLNLQLWTKLNFVKIFGNYFGNFILNNL
jgi:hypothetical protein